MRSSAITHSRRFRSSRTGADVSRTGADSFGAGADVSGAGADSFGAGADVSGNDALTVRNGADSNVRRLWRAVQDFFLGFACDFLLERHAQTLKIGNCADADYSASVGRKSPRGHRLIVHINIFTSFVINMYSCENYYLNNIVKYE
ncbi:MAG: hypothetical protein LBH04_07410 [Tannerellaceae bacterium]|jgi:hypothetical protein|nr:hypothetical protein [Tannerellaceae bacterium]